MRDMLCETAPVDGGQEHLDGAVGQYDTVKMVYKGVL